MPLRSITIEQETAVVSEAFHTTHLIIELWVYNKMEVIVDLLDLCEIFILHAATGLALGAVLGWIREQDLVDYYVVNVDFVLGKLDGQPLRLVHGEELWDADGDKRRLISILELLINILNLCLHGVD